MSQAVIESMKCQLRQLTKLNLSANDSKTQTPAVNSKKLIVNVAKWFRLTGRAQAATC